MFSTKQLEELTKKLYGALPISLQNFENEIQQQFHEILQAAFSSMDLVTREEFDVQLKVLARTREKVEILQQQVELILEKSAK